MSGGQHADVGGVTLRYWASLRAAAGVSQERVQAGRLVDLLAAAKARRDPRFGQVLGVCSVLVDEQPVGARDPATVDVFAGSVVDLLPPFAGGAAHVCPPSA